MTVQYDLKEQERIYGRWARIYDALYLRLLEPAQRKVATWAREAGPRVLEVGVGTGLALRYYDPAAQVVGIDLSLPMLQQAALKIEADRLGHVAGVAAMDACRLGFADATFDAVTVPFVITLVPDPEGALDEAARVLRPGGCLIIASRFGAEAGPQAALEGAIAPLVKKVGWSSAFKVSRIRAWAGRHGGMSIDRVEPGLFFTVLRLHKAAAAALARAA